MLSNKKKLRLEGNRDIERRDIRSCRLKRERERE